jgi:hypothetical protein
MEIGLTIPEFGATTPAPNGVSMLILADSAIQNSNCLTSLGGGITFAVEGTSSIRRLAGRLIALSIEQSRR